MKKIIIFYAISLLFNGFIFSAGMEKYDHMDIYKGIKVNGKGPYQENVYDANEKEIAVAAYKYNENGQLIEALYTKNNANDGKTKYTYNEGLLQEEIIYNSENVMVEKLVYKYNKGRLSGYTVSDSNGKEVLRWQYSYKNNKISSGIRFIEKEITEKFTVQYEKNGNSVYQIYYPNDEKAGTIETYFNKENIVKREKVDVTGKYIINYRYDNENRLLEMVFYEKEKKGETMVLQKTHKLIYAEIINPNPEKISLRK